METHTDERMRANAWGRYYVTSECDACGVCADRAPYNMGRGWDRTYYAVAFQPVDDAEEQAMADAMAACPMHCIHDDGEA